MKKIILIGLIFSVLFIAGCIASPKPFEPAKETGNLVLSIIDKEVKGIEELNVTISAIEIHKVELTDETDDKENSIELCKLNKEYIHNAVNSVECKCPEGYKFKTVSTGLGPCPEEGMGDCPETTLKCIKETENNGTVQLNAKENIPPTPESFNKPLIEETENAEPELNTEKHEEKNWILFSSKEQTFDLMKLKSSQGLKELLGEKELTNGKYTQIRLTIKKVTAVINDKEFNVIVPTEKIKLTRNFTITAGKTTELIIDFSPESIIKAGNTYKLKPVIKILTLKEFKKKQTEKPKETEIDFSVVESGIQSAKTKQGFDVINDSKVWFTAYKKIHVNQIPLPELPEVDFEKNTVIAVFLGEKNNPKYGMDLIKVMETKNHITVFMEETFTELNKGTAGIQITVKPYEIISIPKTIKEIKVIWTKTGIQNQNFCETNLDCSCGRNKETGDCFLGNKEFVTSNNPCPDFCSGIAGNLTAKCINNKCKLIKKEKPVVDTSEFLNQKCDAVNSCPEGFDCASFPEIGLKCYPTTIENPCDFVDCQPGKECIIAESYPVQIFCS